mmetsp:Transcript_70679/g.117412  ORF Transcript_70679/g.117412 Transcript_70679/m.117412 type:complete len:159 (+) Transcript_70679:66-542(+)|eukprot:CAMPEP_0119302836 /NCGR_PEP_ID=MMETSP1333-20130426/4366_1 /TAXON_ID=418940 /ORGANISM="Scyphosphaera apsteinii, Strain RCC1455" /LENGTH=158 /DNA_ID=CAMNT_0007305313 /DNA_START=61 /DNA_END=537 /DNA_ORIENTATION=-
MAKGVKKKNHQHKGSPCNDTYQIPWRALLVLTTIIVPLAAFLAWSYLDFNSVAGTDSDMEDTQAVGELFDVKTFQLVAQPLIHKFIFSRYDEFAASKLSFRHLKQHLSTTLGIPYETLARDEISLVIEDVTDTIANACKMGEVPKRRCMAMLNLDEGL